MPPDRPRAAKNVFWVQMEFATWKPLKYQIHHYENIFSRPAERNLKPRLYNIFEDSFFSRNYMESW